MQALVFDNSLPRQALTKVFGVLTRRAYVGPLAPMTLKVIADPALPAPDWVRIRTHLCGICGSDYKQVFLNGRRDNPMTALVSFPQVLGHEVVGVIDSVGPACRNRRPGERVVLNPWLSCAPRGIKPVCPACRAGRLSLCESFARGHIPQGSTPATAPPRRVASLLSSPPTNHSASPYRPGSRTRRPCWPTRSPFPCTPS
jgi:hypothetical protein